MYLALGQGVGNMCVAGERNGPNVNITGQGWDTARNCPRDSESAGCENYSGQRRVFTDAGDKNLNLTINRCASMEVTHAGESFSANLTQCSVGLNLQATKSNNITLGANGTGRINVGKQAGPVNITMSGTPTVTKDPSGDTYSIVASNGQFLTISGPIGLVKINGATLKSLAPPEPEKEPDPNAPIFEKKVLITGADIISGRYRNGMNGGSSFGSRQSLGSQTSNNQSSGSLTTDPSMSKSSSDANSVVNTTVALDATAQKSQEMTTAPDSSVSEQVSQAEIDAKMAANAAAQANSVDNASPTQQNMFPPNLPPVYQMLFMFLGMFQQQYIPTSQPPEASPFNQQRYFPWW